MKYLLDTNIAIDFLGGLDELSILEKNLHAAELYASAVTRMELLSYRRLTAETEQAVQRFLAALTVLPIDREVERVTIAIRRGAGLKLPDAIIAATAWAVSATLVTRDRRLAALKWPGLAILTF